MSKVLLGAVTFCLVVMAVLGMSGGCQAISGSPIAEPVESTAPGGSISIFSVLAVKALKVTVTITSPGGHTIALDGTFTVKMGTTATCTGTFVNRATGESFPTTATFKVTLTSFSSAKLVGSFKLNVDGISYIVGATFNAKLYGNAVVLTGTFTQGSSVAAVGTMNLTIVGTTATAAGTIALKSNAQDAFWFGKLAGVHA